jgi:ATP-dependent Lhr-like helicase
MLLETYRECLRDVFDLPAPQDFLQRVQDGRLRVVPLTTRKPSPFASSLLFSYVANFIYDGDAPLAERRAQALSVDQAQLRELLGEAEMRELIDPGAIEAHERGAQRQTRPARGIDGLHDLLLALGDLSEAEVRARFEGEPPLAELVQQRRAFAVTLAGEQRFMAAEDAARARDALGATPPEGLPRELLAPVADPLGDLVSRWARTHGPFRPEELAARWGIAVARVREALERLASRERVLEGEFLPHGRGREWVDAEVLKSLRRRSLARLRKQVEPVEPAALARFVAEWQGVARPRRGLDALLGAIEQLQGAPLVASTLEQEVLAARVHPLRPGDVDLLFSAGELVWRGLGPLGNRDGRVALYLTDRFRLLAAPPRKAEGALCEKLRAQLQRRGASFFADLQVAVGAFPADLLAALWEMVWAGEVTNDTLAPLRSLMRGAPRDDRRDRRYGVPFRSRRVALPGSEGRWSLLPAPEGTPTERAAALARGLLARHGVVTRESAHAEEIAGGFAAVYPVLRAMEEAGKARRGYFVAGLGGAQFAMPGAEERLRGFREPSAEPLALVLAATDPANPYGATVPWPRQGPQRAAGAQVVLHDGALLGWLGRGERNLETFVPAEEPARSQARRALARALAGLVDGVRRRALLIAKVDGADVGASPLAADLRAAGFTPGIKGFLRRVSGVAQLDEDEEGE